jgi:cysteine-rich repeat protein
VRALCAATVPVRSVRGLVHARVRGRACGGYCDDGNLESGDGCSRGCQVECGYTCRASRDACETVCGDGLRAGTEECDGNSAGGDGYSSTCEVEAGWTCSMATCGRTWCSEVCGDGLHVRSEECDDGDREGYDGSSYYCSVECGYTCTGGEDGDLCSAPTERSVFVTTDL